MDQDLLKVPRQRSELPPIPPFHECYRSAWDASGLAEREIAWRIAEEQANIHRYGTGLYARGPKWTMVWKLIALGGLGLEYFFPADVILGAADRIRTARKT